MSGQQGRPRRRGFTVYAPPSPLRGLPQDSAYLHQFLTQNAALAGQPVVVAAHSYGGAVITGAAAGAQEPPDRCATLTKRHQSRNAKARTSPPFGSADWA